VVSDQRHTSLLALVEPALDSVAIFHLHDNLGSRRGVPQSPELDPLRLDLHLAPGRGTLPWQQVVEQLRRHEAPLMLEVHPPHRGSPESLRAAACEALAGRQLAAA
jgi:sugar phosphate isomerase/epimerase